jgi:hypothetical protein
VENNQRHERTASLLPRGATAARAGDCTTVSALAPQILARDPDGYRRFVADPKVARCLWLAAKRDEAVGLAHEAVDAARAGNCKAATRHAKRIQDLDPHVYEVSFLASPEVQSCLGASR